MADAYYLKLMGFPELRRPDGRPVKLKVRKHLALLIYLIMDGREVYFRDELAELLWPEVPEENSRHSLSMAFSVLRGLFGPGCIRGTHSEVRFTAPGVRLDLDRLESGDILGSETMPPLEVDGFLRDFQIDEASAFQHWRDRKHAQLLPLIQAGILTLTDQARRSADLPRMMALANRLLALDPLAEEGIRARVEAFALQGDRVSALRVFEEWKQQLFQELGAAPSEILEAMASRLRRRGAESSLVPSGPAPSAVCERRFVGRATEYGVLFEAWELTTQLDNCHVLLTGETGIGKSTLAMRFASAAALEGAAVARVQCFELEQRIPFGMIGALVTSLLDCSGVMGTAPESLAEVARIVPRVKERFPHLPAPRQTEGEAARLHFAEGTFALLDAIMEEQPIVLIVDDYPRSDEASLSVLHMLLRRAANDRLMIVLSGRPPEPGEPAQATRIRKGVSYLPLRHLDLAPLSEQESDDLLQVLLTPSGKAPGSPERRSLLRTAGGNPMALELLTQDWITHGDAALAVLLPAMSAEVPVSALEAIGYDRLIERMLPALTPRTRVALYLAAILGPRLNDLEYFEIADFSAAQTMAALSELIERRILRNTEGRLEFVNELIRARLYLKIPDAARVRLHHAVADRLLAAVVEGITIPGLEIAWHCIRSRRRDEAVPYLMSGARGAITHGAPDEAARALSSAVGSLKGRPKAEATLLLAETYQEMAEWKAALECIEALSKKEGFDQDIEEMAKVLEIDSRGRLGQYGMDGLQEIIESLIDRARFNQDPSLRLRAARAAIRLASSLRSQSFIIAAREAVLDISIEDLDKREGSRAYLVTALRHYSLRQEEKGQREILEAKRMLDEIGAMDTTFVEVHIGLGAIACANGLYEAAIVPLERAHSAAIRLDNAPLINQAATNLSLCYSRLGLVQQHLQWATTAWIRSQSARAGSYDRVIASAHLGLAYLESGQSRKAIEALGLLRKASEAAEVPWVRQSAKMFEADLTWLLGNKDRALKVVEEMRAFAPSALTIGLVGRVTRWTTVLAVQRRNPGEASILLKQSYESVQQLDLLDQAEVLCSLTTLGGLSEPAGEQVSEQARIVLAKLPIACSQRLKRLGLSLPR